jgi:hypothetical protein
LGVWRGANNPTQYKNLLLRKSKDRTKPTAGYSANGEEEFEYSLFWYNCGLSLSSSVELLAGMDVNILEPSGPLQACNGTALPLLKEMKGQ